MALIRIFATRQQAEFAQNILKEGGINSDISEDKFNSVPIQEFGVPARFRLLVTDEDCNKAAEFLARKLRSRRLKG